jgi:hypothetical protein
MIPERPAIVQFCSEKKETTGFERGKEGESFLRNKRGTIPPPGGDGELYRGFRMSRCVRECGKGTDEGPYREGIIAQMFWVKGGGDIKIGIIIR